MTEPPCQRTYLIHYFYTIGAPRLDVLLDGESCLYRANAVAKTIGYVNADSIPYRWRGGLVVVGRKDYPHHLGGRSVRFFEEYLLLNFLSTVNRPQAKPYLAWLEEKVIPELLQLSALAATDDGRLLLQSFLDAEKIEVSYFKKLQNLWRNAEADEDGIRCHNPPY